MAHELDERFAKGSFVALDFETARPCSGICEIGIATFRDWKVQERWSTRIDPKMAFHAKCIETHQITAACVSNSPALEDTWERLTDFLRGKVVVGHNVNYEKASLENDADRLGLAVPQVAGWECSLQFSRTVWPGHFEGRKGAGELGRVTRLLGVPIKHHQALDDAFGAGMIIVQSKNGVMPAEDPISDDAIFPDQQSQAMSDDEARRAAAREPKPRPSKGGAFEGQSLVVTGGDPGQKQRIERLAAEAGFSVLAAVRVSMSILVVLPYHSDGRITTKEQKVDELCSRPKRPKVIKKLNEEEFLDLIGHHGLRDRAPGEAS